MNNQNLTKCTATLSILLTMFFLSACGSDSEETAGSPRNPVTRSVSGIIEKGPFGQGSKVTLYELRKDLSQTGKSFKTQTTSHLGAFKIDGIELESPYVEMETNGYFYNEVKGEMSVAPITLNAIADITNRNSVNVNIITHLEFERVKKLVKEGSSFSSAKAQAEKELLKCFGITDEISNPENISITDNNRNASILLAISTIMQYNRSEGELTAFMSKFATDFADNGLIDDLSVRNGIKEGQENVHPSDVANKMKEYYGKQNVAVYCEDFSKYIDFNGDGVIDDKDGEYLDIELFDIRNRENLTKEIKEDIAFKTDPEFDWKVKELLEGKYFGDEAFLKVVRAIDDRTHISNSRFNKNQKDRMLLLLHILAVHSSENYALSMFKLQNHLREKGVISVGIQISNAISGLVEIGFDIRRGKDSYYLGERETSDDLLNSILKKVSKPYYSIDNTSELLMTEALICRQRFDKRVTRSELITIHFNYYILLMNQTAGLYTFPEVFEDYAATINPYLEEARYQPLSEKNIFDMYIVTALYFYLVENCGYM